MRTAGVVVAVSVVVRMRMDGGGARERGGEGGIMNLAFLTTFLSPNSRREERYVMLAHIKNSGVHVNRILYILFQTLCVCEDLMILCCQYN